VTDAQAGVDAGFEVVFADAHLLVLNKPSGLLSVPGKGSYKQDCLSTRVQQHCADALVVHRLDMAASGLMLMARGAAMQTALSKLFETRAVHKRYVAVVDGKMTASQDWQLIDKPIALDWPNRPLRTVHIDGKPSQTRWRLLSDDIKTDTTRVELEPVTGRSHQLRVHLKALGHPILGDALYAPADVQGKAARLLLHACNLAFVHPASSEKMVFESPAPF
jgi:tRNA pseudouridine32 synthase / 23S rRNA pseudouridine746 synthase